MPRKMTAQLPPLKQVDEIGKRISIFRKQQGLSQKELAKKIGINRTLLTDYEIGRLHLNDEMIIRLSTALAVSSDAILGLALADYKEPDLKITRRLKELETLPHSDQKKILDHIKDLVDKNNLKKQS